MTLERAFKNTILLNLALLIVGIIGGLISEPISELETINENLPKGFLQETFGIGGLYFFALFLFVYIISLILIYKFIRYGKILFVISVAALLLYVFLSGPSLGSAFIDGIDAIACMLDGAIIIFLYFTPIKEHFEDKN